MWVCLNNAFLSIVEHHDDPNKLLVRARRWEDLKTAFGPADHEILVTPSADYRYRIIVSRWELRAWAYSLADRIDYPNFKASVPWDEPDRAAFYNLIWEAGHDFQGRAPVRRQVPPPDDEPQVVIASSPPATPPEVRPAARMDSWQHQPMRRPGFLAWEDAFSPGEWKRLSRGLIPEVMEEKWFIYVDDEWIHFHRSWTGFELYRARHVQRGPMRVILGVEHETDPEIYDSRDPDYERGMVRWLTRGLILEQHWVDFPHFPHSSDAAKAVTMWHVGGSAAFEPALVPDDDTWVEAGRNSAPIARLDVHLGQIEDSDCDGIVCPTKVGLGAGGAIFKAVHLRAGPQLLDATSRLWGCPLGEARISEGFELPARFVIHLPLPRWNDGDHGEPVLLAAAYRAAFDTGARQGLRTMAVPALGTGGHGFPLGVAAAIGVREARVALDRRSTLRQITFVCLDEETAVGYRDVLAP